MSIWAGIYANPIFEISFQFPLATVSFLFKICLVFANLNRITLKRLCLNLIRFCLVIWTQMCLQTYLLGILLANKIRNSVDT